jgi:hypothetical protein
MRRTPGLLPVLPALVFGHLLAPSSPSVEAAAPIWWEAETAMGAGMDRRGEGSGTSSPGTVTDSWTSTRFSGLSG